MYFETGYPSFLDFYLNRATQARLFWSINFNSEANRGGKMPWVRGWEVTQEKWDNRENWGGGGGWVLGGGKFRKKS